MSIIGFVKLLTVSCVVFFGYCGVAECTDRGTEIRFKLTSEVPSDGDNGASVARENVSSYAVWATSGPTDWMQLSVDKKKTTPVIVLDPKAVVKQIHILRAPVTLELESRFPDLFPLGCDAIKPSNRMAVSSLSLSPGVRVPITFREPEAVPVRIGTLESSGDGAVSHYVVLIGHDVHGLSDDGDVCIRVNKLGMWTFNAFSTDSGFLIPSKTQPLGTEASRGKGREFKVLVSDVTINVDLIAKPSVESKTRD